MMKEFPLGFREKLTFELRSLYNRYGYSLYSMSKFEEYDLYAGNKDFLISEGVITFMDTNGKLMALKPDVTLSIVKNTRDDTRAVQKLYYNENVYRATKSTGAFREMMQVGLECLGTIDEYCLCEVLTLAAETLRCVSGEWILDISHQGLLAEVIDRAGISREKKISAMKCIGEKNLHELMALCRECGVSEEKAERLRQTASLSGPAEQVLPVVRELTDSDTADRLLRVVKAVEPEELRARIRFDFSAVDDIHFYNGFVFMGFVITLPACVLTGGQYDNLMAKMGRKAGAIGFAVYMDALEGLEKRERDYDADTLILYGDGTDLSVIRRRARERMELGESVLVQQSRPENKRFRQVLRITDGEMKVIENDA